VSGYFQRAFSTLLLPLAVTGMVLTVTRPATAASVYDLVAGGTNLEGYFAVGLPGINPIHFSSGPFSGTGNVAVGAGGTFHFDGGGTIHGTLIADPTATINISSSTITGGVIQNFTAAATVSNVVNAANALAAYAANAALTPTEAFSTSITGNGGQNVIDVPGGISLSGGSLTITGGPNDVFIFDVGGSGIQISGGAHFVLNGITANQVLFYMPGSANNVLQTSSGSNAIEGIFLAPNGGIQINGGIDIAELIAKTTLTAQSNPTISPPPVPMVPEPASVSLSLLATVALGLWIKRSRKTIP
jgi:hypothetical protein